MEKNIIVYTDGACSGNPGPGGWAAVIISEKNEISISGGEKTTTNNRMELCAAIFALEKIAATDEWARQKIHVFIDSQYVKNGITEWIKKWKINGWRTASKKPIKNQELWLQLDAVTQNLDVHWEWVKGHSGNKYNELCDMLAVAACKEASLR